MRKISSLFFVLMIIFQSISVPVFAFTNTKEVKYKHGIVTTDDENDEVPIFKDYPDSSNLLTILHNGDQVEILDEFDGFSYITFIKDKSDESIEGFIENKHLSLSNDENIDENEQDIENENKSDKLDEDKDSINTDESVEENEKDEQIEEYENDNKLVEINEDEETIDTNESIEDYIKDEQNIVKGNDTNLESVVDENDSDPEVITDELEEVNESPSIDKPQRDIKVLQVQPFSNQQEVTVVGLRNPTNIRATDSTKSGVIGTYTQGSIINVKTYSKNWYEHTTNDGKKGYIHHKHVDNVTDKSVVFSAIGINSPTNIRELASTRSNVVKPLPIGSIIEIRTFSTNWYEAVEGNKTIGYIHHNHIGDTVTISQNSFKGIGINSPTNIRELPSTNAKIAEKRPIGDIIDLRSFSEHWYQATTKSGKTGYVHKYHIGDTVLAKQNSFQGIGINSPTNIRELPSTNAKVAETRPVGDIISLESFSQHWYKATTSKGIKGYVHKNHIGDSVFTKQDFFYGEALNSLTNIRVLPSTQAQITLKYKKGATVRLQTFSKHWHEVIDLNNKRIGFVHRNHVNEKDNITTKYDISLKDGVEMQMKNAPQTDKKYAWVSKDYIDKNNKVTASSLNVRTGPGTGHSSVGTIKNGTKVNILDEHNGWYAVEYNSSGQWKHAGPTDVMYYLNPLNFVNDARQQFQFLDLSRSSSVSATELNKVLNNNGVLHGKGSYFIEAGNKYKINDIYLVSHAKLETGNGASELATGISKWTKRNSKGEVVKDNKGNPIIIDISPKKVYNMYGIGAFDSCARDCGAQRAYDNGWFSVETAIVEGAEFIGSGYINSGQNTLYKMRWNPVAMENGSVSHQYATDIGWAFKQTYTISELYKQLGSYTLHLDIPVYKK